MKKYFANLRPMERRLVVGVGVVLLIVLNWVYIWPHFSDWTNYTNRLDNATRKLARYRTAVAEVPELQKKVKSFENAGDVVQPEDQAVNFMRTIQQESAQCGVQLQNFGRPIPRTNDVFFIEQEQNINVLAVESNLVDFLYKLGSGSSMIRVRELTLQPDPPHQRLVADIRLVASYQKTAKAAAPKSANKKAK